MPIIKKIKVAVKTSSEARSGTDASIYLGFVLPTGGRIYLLPTEKEHLESGQLDVYHCTLTDGPNLQDVVSTILVNGMTGPNPSWKVLWVKVDVVDDTGHAWRIVDEMPDRWLDTRHPQGPAAILPIQRPPQDLGVQDVVGPATIELTSLG